MDRLGGPELIYEFPPVHAPIRQGDIFLGIPRVDVSFANLFLVDETGEVDLTWADAVSQNLPVSAVLPLVPVVAIVTTQDCDNLHGRDVTLCEIREFQAVEPKATETRRPSAWASILTQHARLNLKWFYLPPDSEIGFGGKMAVDFTLTVRVSRRDLESLRSFRKGRLNPVADEHFRERLSEFYRRYPYDEWYPLNREEFLEYRKKYPDAAPFPWQGDQT